VGDPRDVVKQKCAAAPHVSRDGLQCVGEVIGGSEIVDRLVMASHQINLMRQRQPTDILTQKQNLLARETPASHRERRRGPVYTDAVGREMCQFGEKAARAAAHVGNALKLESESSDAISERLLNRWKRRIPDQEVVQFGE
jgi:hypothetical protein